MNTPDDFDEINPEHRNRLIGALLISFFAVFGMYASIMILIYFLR